MEQKANNQEKSPMRIISFRLPERIIAWLDRKEKEMFSCTRSAIVREILEKELEKEKENS
jgi:metal-responsive CopG/Arc/MetJ family transcriptional regulator